MDGFYLEGFVHLVGLYTYFLLEYCPKKYKLLPTLPCSHSFRLSNSLFFFFFLLWVGGGGDAGNKQMRLSFKRN